MSKTKKPQISNSEMKKTSCDFDSWNMLYPREGEKVSSGGKSKASQNIIFERFFKDLNLQGIIFFLKKYFL